MCRYNTYININVLKQAAGASGGATAVTAAARRAGIYPQTGAAGMYLHICKRNPNHITQYV